EMIKFLEKNPNVGVATCALKNKDDSIQSTGGYFPNLLNVFSWMTIQDLPLIDLFIKPFHPLHAKSFFFKGEDFYKNQRKMDWVTGAFLLTQKTIVEEIGGWDESYFMYMEEVDLCYRVKRLGYEVGYLPNWSIVHLGGASSTISGYSILAEFDGVKNFFKKFYPEWEYPLLRLALKIGALGRVVLFGILNGKEAANIYVSAFEKA
ncbi:glycosyltransferase family 2 protein, partial [Candidatus Woesebacteria bacterium]|nr:glycosyltransferase family 2 protein [Candidatus Woesebacteria bacterium]